MAAPKPLILTFHFKFQPLAALCAALTGLALSLMITVSVTDHVLFSSLRQLWSSFLTWFTPHCLFVVLNGIIVALSASSGVLSSPTSGPDSSDFCPKLLSKMPIFQAKRISENPLEVLPADVPPPNLSATVPGRAVPALTVELPPLSTDRLLVAFNTVRDDQVGDLEFYDAEDEIESNIKADESHFVKSESVAFYGAHHRSGDKGDGDDENKYAVQWPIRPAKCVAEKKMALFCREDGDFVRMTRRSLPYGPEFPIPRKPKRMIRSISVDSAPCKPDEALSNFPSAESLSGEASSNLSSAESLSGECAIPRKPKRMMRSLSVDSAPCKGDEASSKFSSAETLSSEAFRKRIEDFIAKKYAQLRNEVG